jgi:hypothetical protein
MAEAQAIEAKQASNVVTSENLTEWTLDRLGLATEETPTEAEAVEETPESEPVAEEGESEHDQEPEGKATEERKQNPKLEKRFSELTKARKQAEENAAKVQAEKEALEARLREYEDRQAPQQQQKCCCCNPTLTLHLFKKKTAESHTISRYITILK